jgi:hypothetical protein
MVLANDKFLLAFHRPDRHLFPNHRYIPEEEAIRKDLVIESYFESKNDRLDIAVSLLSMY